MSDRIPTIADVCSAIAEGHVPVAIDGSVYQVNALELRRYFTKYRPLPAVATPPETSSHPDSSQWSSSATTSVA